MFSRSAEENYNHGAPELFRFSSLFLLFWSDRGQDRSFWLSISIIFAGESHEDALGIDSTSGDSFWHDLRSDVHEDRCT